MAHVERRGSFRVGRYGVDVKAIDDVARESLALDPRVEIFLVDEIGKMECYSGAPSRCVVGCPAGILRVDLPAHPA
jgi:nucleoside-triphosphatase